MKSSDHKTIFAVKLRASKGVADLGRLLIWVCGMTLFIGIMIGFIGWLTYELAMIVKGFEF